MLYNGKEKLFYGPLLFNETHPHMKLEDTMVSVPRVEPGDMVFWHCVRDSRIL